MLVKDVMTRGLETVSPETTICEAAQKMASLDVGALPIAKGSEPIGIVTDRDICIRAVADGKDPNTCTVGDVMTENAITLTEDQDVEEAGRIMKDKKIRRLLVVDGGGALCGIVSVGDLVTEEDAQDVGDAVVETVSEPAAPNR